MGVVFYFFGYNSSVRLGTILDTTTRFARRFSSGLHWVCDVTVKLIRWIGFSLFF